MPVKQPNRKLMCQVIHAAGGSSYVAAAILEKLAETDDRFQPEALLVIHVLQTQLQV